MLQGLALSNRPAQPPAFTSVRCGRDWHSQIGLHSHQPLLVSDAAGTGTLKSACTAIGLYLCQMRQGLALSNRPAQRPVLTCVRCCRDWHSQIGLHSHPPSLVSDAAGTGTLKSACTAISLYLCQMRQGLALSNRPAQPPAFTSVRCGRDWHSQIGLHSHPSSLV